MRNKNKKKQTLFEWNIIMKIFKEIRERTAISDPVSTSDKWSAERNSPTICGYVCWWFNGT